MDTDPKLLPSGALLMHTGMLTNIGDAPGVYLTPAARQLLKVDLGDYVEIRDQNHGTCVNRSVRGIMTTCPVRDDYAYLDADSLGYLGGDLHDEIEVIPTNLQLDVP